MTEQNQLIKQENPQDVLMAVIETGPETLMLNQEQIEKTKTAVEKLLSEIAAGGMTDELDAYCNKVQLRIKEVFSELQDRRKPLTSRLNAIVKSFTEMEQIVDPGRPDSLFAQIGKHRNAYATKKAEEQRRRDEEAARKLAITQERNRLIGDLDIGLRNGFIQHMTEDKQYLQELFNTVTLDNFIDVCQRIEDFGSDYDLSRYDRITVSLRPVYLTSADTQEIQTTGRAGKFELWAGEYKTAIETAKREILDKMPGVKRHLEEKKAADEERIRKEDEARIAAENARKIQDEELRKKAEEEARQKEIEAENARKEQARLDEEKRKKEEEDRIKAEEERVRLEKENELKVKAETEVRDAGALFDNQLQLTGTESATAVESWEIILKSPAAYLHVVSHFFTFKGNKEEMETLGKTTLNQMKKFCETDYKKNDRKIDSPLVEYKPTYKVAARK